ncbi:inorganic pyrophosphatase [Chloropicon primus]|uniref:inorganic diphosphatase n=1 Tax=Chloropicon primus TaxID=1764295 RepID=A0A5B8MVU1_9CHLO|nr:inorganic pyrophosphatase [Chloropicon primus]UPR03574.1 inorganic pyrophosphatase [Chloropicon primus]|mmetsp:Transcript_1280/g.3720  ORF Transcript_1280/g.3720 Transcript_1280/m.3720 type:complete len:309 (-) Transcript_1280:137-1063(-)|eukprot:QDZ24366.1 inorganic pyrophosphatase [Chloropicon primus]
MSAAKLVRPNLSVARNMRASQAAGGPARYARSERSSVLVERSSSRPLNSLAVRGCGWNVQHHHKKAFRLFSTFKSEASGDMTSQDFRIFFKDSSSKVVSPWHDIPLKSGEGTFNFVCEIPKETSAKMEVATDEKSTPIKQDIKKGNLRFYPYNINWNYGLFPQTWEDPGHIDKDCEVAGDNDPVDVVEIGSSQLEMGGVYEVKVLGVYAMIDDGELDWKVITINVNDPKADKVNNVDDIEREFPGELEKILIWFRDYKMPDGKPQNKFGYDNKCLDKDFALKVIDETHEFYNNLKSGARENTEELSLS